MKEQSFPHTIPTFVVGIGGSAGGLKAYSELLQALPSNTGMAFVFISHMSPSGESILAHLLARVTEMPSSEAANGMKIQADHIYVIAPNTNLLIENSEFKVVVPRTLSNGRHNQVDLFPRSLAKDRGPSSIGIILSGGDGDGTEGCKLIKAAGGKTFAQDLSADVESMPLHAQAAGCVDFVLSPTEISAKLVSISNDAKLSSVGR